MSQFQKFIDGTPIPDVETITGNAGGPVAPDALHNINLLGGNNITTTGTPLTNTITISVTGTTNHAIQLGNGTGSLTSAGLLTNGQLLIGSTGVDPVAASITNGNNISWTSGAGTLRADLTGTTNHRVQIGNATGSLTSLGAMTNGQLVIGSTGVDPAIASIGNGNNITWTAGAGSLHADLTGTTNHTIQLGNAGGSLTSATALADGELLIGVAGADPVAATLTAGANITITEAAGSITIAGAPPGIGTITGDSGSVTGATVFIRGSTSLATAGASVDFVAGSATELDLSLTDANRNTLLGIGVGFSISGQNNTGLGAYALNSGGVCNHCTAVGNNALSSHQGNDGSTAVGSNCFPNSFAQGVTGLGYGAGNLATNASYNVAIGHTALNQLLTGDYNVAIGSTATATNYTNNESSNITINCAGTTGESNVLRIGNATGTGVRELNAAYICGINGIAVSGNPLFVSSTDQIGTATLTDGQLIIGSTGNPAAISTLTAGIGVTITNGAGSITIDCTGGGLAWSNISASATLVVNAGVNCTGGGALSLALPGTSSVGDIIRIVLDGSTSWTITQAANQQIRFGSSTTTLGVGGSIASTAQGDAIEIVCKTANLVWTTISSIGNLTVV